MRGQEKFQQNLFNYISPEQRIPKDHPLHPIRKIVDQALQDMHGRFSERYCSNGRPSVPPEQLLRALLLQVFYTIRGERLLMEQLHYNLLFRWFVGLSMDDPVGDHSTFSKNRDRLLNSEIATGFFQSIREQARQKKLMSDEHFTVDGTLLEARASMKSFKPKDASDGNGPSRSGQGRNPTVDFRGQKRKNDTHASTTDKEEYIPFGSTLPIPDHPVDLGSRVIFVFLTVSASKLMIIRCQSLKN
jgi:transposase